MICERILEKCYKYENANIMTVSNERSVLITLRLFAFIKLTKRLRNDGQIHAY